VKVRGVGRLMPRRLVRHATEKWVVVVPSSAPPPEGYPVAGWGQRREDK
jgi:hypothetical protein